MAEVIDDDDLPFDDPSYDPQLAENYQDCVVAGFTGMCFAPTVAFYVCGNDHCDVLDELIALPARYERT